MRMRGSAGRRGRRRRDGRRPGAALGLLAGLAASPVQAAEGDLRLADGVEPHSGRLEVYLDGVWGTVCDDAFGVPDANVACRQLKYGRAVKWRTAFFVGLQGTGPIHMDDLRCVGSEARLVNCAYNPVHNCDHWEDVVLYCSERVGATATSPTVEEGLPARFRLARQNSAAALTVSVSVTETGGMIDGEAPASVSFAVGETERILEIPTEDDDLPEPESAVTVSIDLGEGHEPDPRTATVVVVDNDTASTGIGLWASPATVSEDDGPTAVTVTAGLNGAPATAATTVTVTVAGSGDPTAVDFAPVADFTVTVPAGDVAGTATFTLAPVNDAVDENNETLTVSGTADLPVTQAYVALLDDEHAPRMTIHGSESPENGFLDFVVTIKPASSATVAVDYETEVFPPQGAPAFRLAEAGSDFVAQQGRLTFAPGETSKTVSIEVLEDLVDEPVEAVVVTVSDPVGAVFEYRLPSGKCPWRGCFEEGCCDCGTILDDDPVYLSIGDPSAPEDAVHLEFDVALSGETERLIVVDYGTVDGSALAGEDYRAVLGSLTFDGGSLRRTIRVEPIDDDRDEPRETFLVRLSGPPDRMPSYPEGTGTIIDNDDVPSFSVSAARGVEGGSAGFAVTLAGSSSRPATVSYATSDGTATAGEDYGAVSGTLTFAPGMTAETVWVSLLDDDRDEPDETFAVMLWSAANATIATADATGTVDDDDDPPAFSVDGGSDVEGGAVVFNVDLAGESSRAATVSYATLDVTAVAGGDYEAASGTLTFAPGDASATITVPLLDDDLDEPAETFAVVLSSATRATVDKARAVGTIIDNDERPAVSIAAATGREGGPVAFRVRLGEASGRGVTVAFATRDGTAVADEDYGAASGTLTFAPGATVRTVTVRLHDDARDEPEETFSVALSAPVNAVLGLATADGVIVDDDDPPVLSAADGSGVEGGAVVFGVDVVGEGSRAATVSYATADGTAVAGVDYEAASGTLTIAPGDASATITVALLDDDLDEPAETFAVVLSSATHATVGRARAAGTILDDDGAPQLSVADARGAEGGAAAFAVTLAGSTSLAVTVAYATADGTAVAGADYAAASGTLTFAPGDATATVSVALLADGVDEAEETFALQLSAPANATLAVSSAAGAIGDADPPPALSVADARGTEGGAAAFAVTLAGSTERRVTVAYATADGTARAGGDYGAVSGTLTFAPGDASATVSVALLADGVDEAEETFALRLSSPANATLAAAAAVGTIADADGRPVLSVAGGRGAEGGPAAFAVTLAGTTARRVTVSYATADGTAVAGVDYVAASGTLTLAPGETRRTLSVALLDDAADEPEERFALALSSPAHAVLGTASATWTIVDDDPAAKAPTRGRVLVFEPAAHPVRQGFVRVINHSAAAGEVLVEAIDDAGARFGPVALAVGAGAATHFNSDDLEAGNAAKGLPAGVGPPGEGVWRLELSSELDVEVLSYARTADGFVTALHDTAPAAAGVHRAVFLNPGGNVDQVSRLRLVNPGAADAVVAIAGVDDAGAASGVVSVEVPAGASRERTAAELESGAGVAGALGDGEGKWRLRLSSDRPVAVLSLIESPTGNLTNLSTLPRNAGRAAGSHAVPLFPSAADAAGRQGFVRVANRSSAAAAVRVEAFDRTDWAYAAVTLSVAAGGVASFNSDDLELGSTAKGLDGGTGAGDGDWWLELSGGGDLGVWSYVRTRDGFLTSMHDAAPATAAGVHRVVFFNPARNVDQVSVLWLVNPGDAAAAVAVTGVDDAGASPGTAVRTTVPAGSSRRLTSAELETGVSAAVDGGALGEGEGKWRLRVESDRPIRVMSLLENPTGHLTNLSTAPGRGANDGPIP